MLLLIQVFIVLIGVWDLRIGVGSLLIALTLPFISINGFFVVDRVMKGFIVEERKEGRKEKAN